MYIYIYANPATLCVAGFAACVVALGCGFSCARVLALWLCEDLID